MQEGPNGTRPAGGAMSIRNPQRRSSGIGRFLKLWRAQAGGSLRERRMEPSFVQPGPIATHDCANLNRSLIVHSLSRKNGEPEDLAAIPDGIAGSETHRVGSRFQRPSVAP